NELVEIENTNGILIYPNPARNILNLNIAVGLIDWIEIYSLTGQLLHKTESNKSQEQIDISGLPNGNYFIRAICRDAVFVRKFVVVR
ncbi:MAG: T9SS type A sorting domain-containing protein, partial [Bacteroidales bacterium]|nr:T9SS type A sorting domain-containing protein [Bacteroidales bacterium]